MKCKAAICWSEQNEYWKQKPQLPASILRLVYFLFTLFRHVFKAPGIAFNLIRCVYLALTNLKQKLFMTTPRKGGGRQTSQGSIELMVVNLSFHVTHKQTAPLCFRYLWACVRSPLISKTAEDDHINTWGNFQRGYPVHVLKRRNPPFEASTPCLLETCY